MEERKGLTSGRQHRKYPDLRRPELEPAGYTAPRHVDRLGPM